MKYFGKIGEFTIELLQYASDNDIRIFLENCSKFLVPCKETEEMKHNGYYKKRLLNYLYEYIFAFCELKLKTTYPVETDDIKQEIQEEENYKYLGNGVDVVTQKLTPLYLHLYALCECYQSYIRFFIKDEISGTIDLTKINKNKKNIFNLLINNYTENNFYYSFDKKNITKYQITSEKIKEQTVYKYTTKKYLFPDINIPKNSHSYIEYQNVKFLHNQIVLILKNPKRQKYCKWCKPNLKTLKAERLCDNCRKLLFELKLLIKNIDKDEPNLEIAQIKTMNFNDIINNILPNKKDNINKLVLKRKNKLSKIISTLESEINQEIEDKSNEIYYKKLLVIVENIKSQILISFDK